jgi:hypothetical protein
MKNVWWVVAVTILMAGTVCGQVYIKENATITPQQVKKTQDGANNHTITFEFYWDGNLTQNGMVDWAASWDGTVGSCPVNSSISQSTNSYILTLSSPPAQLYSMWANLGVQGIGGDSMVWVDYHWSVYCDNVLVGSESGTKFLCCWGYGDTPWRRCGGVDFLTPYYANFNFSLSSHQIRGGESTGMNLAGMYVEDYNPYCNSTWSPTDLLKLTIASGSQYASFHGPDPQTGTDTKFDSVVTTTGDKVGEYSLVADGGTSDASDCWVSVQAESNGITREDLVQILPSLDHFDVQTEPDTIENSGKTAVFVQAKSKSGQDIGYDGSVQITASPSGYGHLDYLVPASMAPSKGNSSKKAQTVESAGKKSTASTDSVVEVWYGTANYGQVFYVADGDVPESNTTVTFTVTAVDNPSLTGTGRVVIRSSNSPPIVTKINYSPDRKYFPLDSAVSVSAEVTDPDGDSVTVKYEPDQSFVLDKIGENVVKVTATDSKGASSVKYDTIYAVYVAASQNTIIDGGSGEFHVTVSPDNITPDSYAWSWEAKDNPAGNSPHVDFASGQNSKEVTVNKAWWYAFPDDPCRAQNPCSYKLNSAVSFGHDQFEASSIMSVYVPTSGGTVNNPIVVGSPYLSSRNVRGKVEWFVSSKGTLKRQIGEINIPDIPITSQFYPKVLAHEQKHVDQQTSGLASNIWTVENLWNKIKTLKAPAKEVLNKELNAVYKQFNVDEQKKWDDGQRDRELEAYSVSDKTPPFYLYQLCNQVVRF